MGRDRTGNDAVSPPRSQFSCASVAEGVAWHPMPNIAPLDPGAPAPETGWYEDMTVFGSPTGQRVYVSQGDPLPLRPRAFTWRKVWPLDEESSS
jgi:hypothetical protein